jgi:hypothetical protein
MPQAGQRNHQSNLNRCVRRKTRWGWSSLGIPSAGDVRFGSKAGLEAGEPRVDKHFTNTLHARQLRRP